MAPAIAVEPNAAQEVPNKDTRPIDVIDENGAPRTVSPSPKGPDQVRGLFAQGQTKTAASFQMFISCLSRLQLVK